MYKESNESSLHLAEKPPKEVSAKKSKSNGTFNEAKTQHGVLQECQLGNE